ncbi:fluoride efflux transporter CrcB [Nocardioides marinquilinus]|uniref:Fluoride-specific ion channel FluC n=1 Tax=Nocardioides marinquilinus TaxID=1210400 RepID=A0ABP9P417_9ACTN
MTTTTARRDSPGHGLAVALVLLGGFVGTLARYGVSLLLPVTGGWPLGTLAVNLTGAFALAWLVTRFADDARLRLLLGTGVVSGYTTYSTLAVELERLLADGRAVTAVSYAVVSLVGGIGAAVLGHRLATRGER